MTKKISTLIFALVAVVASAQTQTNWPRTVMELNGQVVAPTNFWLKESGLTSGTTMDTQFQSAVFQAAFPVTNGLATTNYVIAATNAGNLVFTNVFPALTNQFATASVTNGLATTNFVITATNNLVIPTTNQFVTSAITNGLATINYANTLILNATNNYAPAVTNIITGMTNGLATTAYVISATNAGNIVFTNTTLFDTNGAGTAAAKLATNQGNIVFTNSTLFDTNGAATAVTNAGNIVFTNVFPALTNGFVTASITNTLQGTNVNLSQWSNIGTNVFLGRNGDSGTNLTFYGDANKTNWTGTTTGGWLNTNTAGGYVSAQNGNLTASGTNTAIYFIGNGGGLTNFLATVKSVTYTNYTATTNNVVLFCTGTNQLITLPSCTATAIGQVFDITAATTTGSVIVTNATGSQTILGGLSISVPATNHLTVINDGSAYW